MKMRSFFKMAAAAVLSVSMLAGCSAPSESNNNSSDGTIKVGIMAPLTGDNAQYGIACRNGAKLYLDQYNEKGGVNGKKIEIVEYDEKGDATEAVNAFNLMVKDGVTAIVGDVTTTPTIAVAIEAADVNMPMITPSATAAEVTSYGNHMFRSCFIDPFQGSKMASYSYEKLGAKTAAIIYDTGNDYSKGLTEAFTSTAKELGLEVVATEGYAKADVDFKSQLTNIAAKNPDVLFCPDYYERIALIAQQAKDAGLNATFVGGDGWDGVLDVVSDTALVEGAYFCSGYSTDDTTPAVQQFLKDYQAAYNEMPNMFAAQAYDAAKILAAALEQAESKGLAVGSDEYKSAIIEAMDATDMDCVTGHITFDENNNPVKDAVIIKITDGKYTFDSKF